MIYRIVIKGKNYGEFVNLVDARKQAEILLRTMTRGTHGTIVHISPEKKVLGVQLVSVCSC